MDARGLRLRPIRHAGRKEARRSATYDDRLKAAAENMKESPDREAPPAPRFVPEIKTRMGQQLRVMFSDVMAEGVPDRHHELLQRLDALVQAARQ
jgi:hypothetical protein